MKLMSQIIFSIFLSLLSSGPAQAADTVGLPELFRKTIPVQLKGGLALVEVKNRCEDCAAWREIDYRHSTLAQVVKRVKVSVHAGYRARYAYPGTDYFSDTKIEQSVPGQYDNDRAVVIDALKHEYNRRKERVSAYLGANPAVKEKMLPLLAKGKSDYIEFEQAAYKGVDYVSSTDNVLSLMGPAISQLHIFVPGNEVIVTAYLSRQKREKFSNIDELLALRREFIEGYIDFLLGAGEDQSIQASNVVVISPTLVTSGQPTATALARLAEQGFKAVIYLAPPTVPDAIPDERDIVIKQGLEFVNIPIAFDEPAEADFEQFVETMNRIKDRKVLVHCQANMRASTMTFLYRVIVGREPPEQAYESVVRVWTPAGPWKRLVVSQLRKAQIDFAPY